MKKMMIRQLLVMLCTFSLLPPSTAQAEDSGVTDLGDILQIALPLAGLAVKR